MVFDLYLEIMLQVMMTEVCPNITRGEILQIKHKTCSTVVK